MKRYNDFITESIRDKMTPKSSDEVEKKLDEMWKKLLTMFFNEYYEKNWDEVYYFFGFKQQDIEELFIEGWSVDEVYDEYKYKIENYLEDSEY
jgi:hypothetical protein